MGKLMKKAARCEAAFSRVDVSNLGSARPADRPDLLQTKGDDGRELESGKNTQHDLLLSLRMILR